MCVLTRCRLTRHIAERFDRLRRQNAMIVLTPAEAVADAMARSSSPPPDPSPPSVLGRQARSPSGDEDGYTTEPDTGPDSVTGSTLTVSAGSSRASEAAIVDGSSASVLRYASKKKLRAEQREEIEVFLQDTPSAQQAKLLTNLMALQNKLDAIRSAAPAYELSENLKINITNYCIAVLLSAHITAYKGDIPRNHVLLCARVALMRAIHIECDGSEKIWNYIDACHEFIRSRAGSSATKLNWAFNNVLKEDQLKYDTGGDYEIEETMVYEWQQWVGDVICGAL